MTWLVPWVLKCLWRFIPKSCAHFLGLLTQPGHRGAGWLCSWSAEIAPLFLRFCFVPFYWQKVLVQYSQQRVWVPTGNCSFHSSLSKGVRIGSPAWHYRFGEVRLAAALTSLREIVSFLNEKTLRVFSVPRERKPTSSWFNKKGSG